MQNIHSSDNDTWDMGLSELIEEIPSISAHQPTRFLEVPDSDSNDTQVYMKRQAPSWLSASSLAA